MKTIALLLCVIYLASYTVRGDDDEVPPSCLQRLGLSIGDIPKLIRDTSDEALRQRGCIEACLMQNVGLMDGNVINMERINEKINNVMQGNDNIENIRKAVQDCADAAVNDDECLAASNFARCGLEHLKLGIKQMLPSA